VPNPLSASRLGRTNSLATERVIVFVCASTRCFPELTLEEACAQFADLQFDKFELWLDDQEGRLRPADVSNSPESFAARVREATRLTPVAITLGSEQVSDADFAAIAKASKLLQITQITVPSSPLGTPFNAEVDRLKEMVRLGQTEGIRVSIKTQSGRLTSDPRTAVELCQSIRGLGLTLDPSYYLGSPLGDQALDMMFPHVYHVHLRDSRPGEVQVQVGLGEIDYSRIVTQLQKRNYNRALSVELLPQFGEPALVPLEMRKLRMLLTTLL
jgi:sugar phosphate isomerase/epimerase